MNALHLYQYAVPVKIILLLSGLLLITPFIGRADAGGSAGEQTLTVAGTIVDRDGEPVAGVTVLVKGTAIGASSDEKGFYSLSIPSDIDAPVLVYTLLGYLDREETVGGRTVIDVRLTEQVSDMDEVVVVGYGTVTRKDVTTAVSIVSTGDIGERPVVSAAQIIQGRAAGVNVYQPNGAPGGEMVIRVRGTTSFNGSNSPLYVVDGVPVDNLDFLSPNDIAGLQILKDASSAAIYGSRAANGVVLVTTKTGRQGAKISFGAQLGVNTVANGIKSLNAAQYKELMDEIRPGVIPDGTSDRTDWFREVYGSGVTQNYQLQVSDGNDRLRYFLSAGYLDEKGTLASAFFRRYNLRANIDNQVRKWLNVSANVSYSDNSRNGVTTGQGSNRGGVVLAVVNLPTASTVRNEEGLYNRSFFGQNITNPVEAIENGKNNKNRENRIIASGSATISFIPELTLKSQFTFDRRNGVETGFTPPVHSTDRDDWGSAWDTRTMNTVVVFDNVLTFKKSFYNQHNVEAMAGTSWTDSDWSQSYINGSHFKDAFIRTLNAANKIAWDNTGSNASQWAIFSVFGRISYNFDHKYLVTVNVRGDGSSKLHPDHRRSVFPSVSAAWRLSAENFMKNLTWVNDLKIRAGWGQTGNQSGVGDYSYLQHYHIDRQPWFEEGKADAVPLVTRPSSLRAADLSWEYTSQFGAGMDLTLLNNRLSLALDYYYKRTTDMLMYVQLPAGQSASSITRNDGEMSNRGFELSVNSRNFTGKFSWSTDFNISFNRNKLEKLMFQKIYYDAETTDAFHQMRAVRNEPGRPLGGFWGYISDGVDPETGELRYRDINGDGRVTSSDKTYIGDPNPKFTFGLTNVLSYKNFNLTLFLQGSAGNDVFNASRGDVEGMYDLKNQSVRVLDRWRIPGQITDVPKARFDLQPSSYFIEDGSYLRVKDITLSYDFGGGFLKKIGVSRLQTYFTVHNLLTLTKYSGMDPEVNQWGDSGAVQGIDWGTYPHCKSFVFGINVEF